MKHQFLREGTSDNYLCGRSPDAEDEPSCENLEVDYDYFNEKIWPTLANRVPVFESLKIPLRSMHHRSEMQRNPMNRPVQQVVSLKMS
ncbi:FAD-dependent oxidoreductase domain-containing protein 1 [Homalodisca vitripennis]|nr:FAD-dependent oxidoreductase domain-containing protein 1 [Homalodisca vitripennis]